MLKYSDETNDIMLKIISSILPREGTEPGDIEELSTKFLTLINLKESEGFSYVMLDNLIRVRRIKSHSPGTKLVITRGTFSTSLRVNLPRYLNNQDVGIPNILDEHQIDANINTPDGELQVKSFFYSYCMKMYDKCFDDVVDVIEGFTLLDSLHQSIMNDLALISLHTSARILETGAIIDRKDYRGSAGYLEYLRDVASLNSAREMKWSQSNSSIYSIRSLEDYNELNNASKNSLYPIGKFNVPPFDSRTHITAGDIYSVIGDEGAGKTNYLVMLAVDQIVAGHSIIFMYGESHPAKIINMMVSRFIFLDTGYKIGWKKIQTGFDELPEEMQAVVNHCRAKLFNDPSMGKFELVKAFHYDNYKQEVRDITSANPENNYTLVFIDHADRLNEERTNMSVFHKDDRLRVKYLYTQLVDMSMEDGVGAVVAVHTSSDAANSVAKGKTAGKRIGATSASTTKDVDLAVHIEANEALDGKGLVKFRPLKFRDYPINKLKPVIMKRDFSCVNYIYSDAMQAELGEGDLVKVELEGVDIEQLID